MAILDDFWRKKQEDFFLNSMKEKFVWSDSDFEWAAKTQPIFKMAIAQYESQQYIEAIESFSQIIESDPNRANNYLYRGTVYEDMGLDIKAKKDFEKTISISSTNYLAWFRLGMLYSREKNFKMAVECLDKSFFYDSPIYLENPAGKGMDNNILFVHKKKIANNLGNFLYRLGRYEEACRVLDDVIENCPDYAYPYYTKAIVLIELGKYSESLPLLQTANNLGHPQAGKLIGDLLKYLGL